MRQAWGAVSARPFPRVRITPRRPLTLTPGCAHREIVMKSMFVLAAALGLGACAPLPDISAGRDPADPAAPVRPVRAPAVLAGTTHYEPVDPKPWGPTNDAVAPRRAAP
jgi:hypothetical protein